MPFSLATALTSRRFCIEKGCPPMRLVVASMRMKATFSRPFSAMARRSLARSMLPLNGLRPPGIRASSATRSRIRDPTISTWTRVDGKW